MNKNKILKERERGTAGLIKRESNKLSERVIFYVTRESCKRIFLNIKTERGNPL